METRSPLVKKDLKKLSSAVKAKFFPKFFKTGVGEYGEGDKFIGVTVPNCRIVSKKFHDLSKEEIENLLHSKIHEGRLTALFILIGQFNKQTPEEKLKTCNFYLENTKYINNWDLVDLSAEKIIGSFIYENQNAKLAFHGNIVRALLLPEIMANSSNLWERRIAIISTFAFIKNMNFGVTLKISKKLINDKEDLLQKAVGWMLREVGKRSQRKEEEFLKKHYKVMPRTMLRYAIEKFPESLRKKYLAGTI